MEESRGKRLAKNTAIIAIGKLCTQFLNFLLLPFYTYLLSKEEYGAVNLVNTFVSLLLPVLTLHIEQGLFLFLTEARGKDEQTREIISVSTFFLGVVCAVSGLVCVLLRDVFANGYVIYMILNLISIACSNTLLQAARGLGDMVGYSAGSFLTGAVTIVLNIIFLGRMNQGGVGILMAAFWGNVAGIFFLSVRIRLFRLISLKKVRWQVLKEILRYSVPLVPNALACWAISASDSTIVSFFMGVGYNGILSAAHKLSSVYMVVYNVFHYSWTEAAVVNAGEEQGVQFLQKTLNSAFRFFSSMCIGMIACIPFVFSWLINSKYQDAYSLIPLFMLASLLNAITSLYGAFYIAKRMSKEIAASIIAVGVINIVLNVALISYIGLWASAVSSVVAYGILVWYRGMEIRKIFSIKIATKDIAVMLCVFCLVFILYLRNRTGTNIISLVIAVIYACTVNRDMLSELAKHLRKFKVKRDQ